MINLQKLEIENNLKLNSDITNVQMSFVKELFGIIKDSPENLVLNLSNYRAVNDDIELPKAA